MSYDCATSLATLEVAYYVLVHDVQPRTWLATLVQGRFLLINADWPPWSKGAFKLVGDGTLTWTKVAI